MTDSILIPFRTLLGPGPANIHPRVFQALTLPLLGHLDPVYLKVLDQIAAMLRPVFQTSNPLTLVTPGTGTSGMEACMGNLIQAGDPVLVCRQGYFGDRLCQMAERQQADLTVLDTEWGLAADPQRLREELRRKSYKLVALVHAETSTGVLQPMGEISRLVREHEALLVLDTVTSLGAVEVRIDEWNVDAAYSCSQKGIGAPPGLSPVTFSERALQAVEGRSRPPADWYLDIRLLNRYWGPERVYHHTSSCTLHYALLEALRLIEEEGLKQRLARHLKHHRALTAGLEGMGLKMFVQPEFRLPTLHALVIPDGVDGAQVRSYLLEHYSIEIGAGLGPLKERVWRVGLMGHSSSAENVLYFLWAMNRALAAQGYRARLAPGLEAAAHTLDVT